MDSHQKIKLGLSSSSEEKGNTPKLQSCETVAIKSYSGLNEAKMNEGASGKVVFSYSFGTCVALIAKLTKGDDKQFAVFHSTYPDLKTTALSGFIKFLQSAIKHGKNVEIVYAVRKSDAEKSKANNAAAPFVLHAMREGGLTDPKITMQRLDIEAYDGVLCDADKNLVIIAQKFIIDCEKTLGVAEPKDAHCTYEASGVGKEITTVPEDKNEELAYQIQAASPKGGPKAFGHFTPTPKAGKSPTLFDFPDVGTASSMSSASASSTSSASASSSSGSAPASGAESEVRTGSPRKSNS